VFYCVADLEAYADNGQSLEESHKIAVDNVADVLALGIDPGKAYIYRQSTNDTVRNLSFIYTKNVTNNMLRAIYGEKPIGLYMVALVQVGDILLPQTEEHGGPRPVVVPVGIDQDPHMRLTRDIAAKHRLVLPSSLYHKFMRSLSGEEKMSKRSASGMITLSDPPETAHKKVMSAITGGQATAEEQRKLGGDPMKCAVYDLVMFQLEDDDRELKRIFDECRTGKRVCGDCKAEIAEKTSRFLRGHQAKKEKLRSKAEQILK
jgi:tryptophanyl-tRNA synthetase